MWTQLKKAAAKADEIFLAPDPDREGEAIAYHLALQLGTSAKERKKIRRVTFNEITKKAVQEAFKHARDVDQNLVDAQQTRRVLDRLVGYQISPLLWDKVRRGLVGRPRADGGGAADCGARAGDWRVSAGGVLDAGCDAAPGEAGGQELQGAVRRHRRRAGAGFERQGQGRERSVHCQRAGRQGGDGRGGCGA